MTLPEYWTIKHFSMAAVDGDLPALLRRVADQLEALGDKTVVEALTSAIEISEAGERQPAVTVYFDWEPEES